MRSHRGTRRRRPCCLWSFRRSSLVFALGVLASTSSCFGDRGQILSRVMRRKFAKKMCSTTCGTTRSTRLIASRKEGPAPPLLGRVLLLLPLWWHTTSAGDAAAVGQVLGHVGAVVPESPRKLVENLHILSPLSSYSSSPSLPPSSPSVAACRALRARV